MLPALALLYFRGGLPRLRLERPAASVLLGVLVFAIWVGPDLLVPSWRTHWLFQNAVFGRLTVSLPGAARENWIDLALRSVRACTVVAFAEELFWRGWLMRWLIREDFDAVPVGAWAARAFLLTAVLFGVEHGPYWEVGIAAGLLYNWWAVRTRSLGDLILAHGVTNAVLAAFVIATRRWEFWM